MQLLVYDLRRLVVGPVFNCSSKMIGPKCVNFSKSAFMHFHECLTHELIC